MNVATDIVGGRAIVAGHRRRNVATVGRAIVGANPRQP